MHLIIPSAYYFIYDQVSLCVPLLVTLDFCTSKLCVCVHVCVCTVLTSGYSCRPLGGRWRSRNGLWECRDAPWSPWKSFCWPPTEPLWQTGRNRALRPPSGRPQYLEETTKLGERNRVKSNRMKELTRWSSRTCRQGNLRSDYNQPYVMILAELSQDGVVTHRYLCMERELQWLFSCIFNMSRKLIMHINEYISVRVYCSSLYTCYTFSATFIKMMSHICYCALTLEAPWATKAEYVKVRYIRYIFWHFIEHS